MSRQLVVVVCALTAVCCVRPVAAETVYDGLLANANFSKFVEALERDQISKFWLQQRTATVFAPTNEAFEKASNNARTSSSVAPLHIAGVIVHKEQFPITISSTKQIAAPLTLMWKDTHVGHTGSHGHRAHGEREYFVDNAKIIGGPYQYRSSDGLEQQLYVIDEVLEPFIPSGGLAPTANGFIQKEQTYDSVFDSSFDVFASLIR